MKKSIYLFLFVFMVNPYNFLIAQNGSIVESEYFKEIIGWSKLKILSNGNTAKIDVTDEEGIIVTLYDVNGKTIKSNNLILVNFRRKMKDLIGKGIFEINNELILFFLDYPKDIPTLIRIRIDIQSGSLIKEDIVAELPKMTIGNSYAIGFGNVDQPDFLVEKDVESDYYGVLIYNSFAKESSERIEVIHFNPNHTELNRSYYTSPENSYKYLVYTSMFVRSSEYILVSTLAYNTKASGGESSALYFSKLESGKKEFNHFKLDYTENYYDNVSCVYEYDYKNQIIYYLIMTSIEKKLDTYAAIVQPYSIKENKMLNSFSLPFSMLSSIYAEKLPKSKEYRTMPQSFSIDQNGNMTVLLQKSVIIYSDGSAYTNLFDIGLTNFTIEGKENYGKLIPYSNRVVGGYSSHFYRRMQKGLKPFVGYMPMGVPRPYMYHVDMITGKENNYILLNTTLKNFENELYGISSVFGIAISSSHAVSYKIDKIGNISKNYLLKKSDNPIENKFCLFYTSDFKKESGKYAVISRASKSIGLLIQKGVFVKKV